jgi:hypothetical protein
MNELQERTFSRDAPDSTADKQDRDRAPRTRIARPVYVRPADPSEARFEKVMVRMSYYEVCGNRGQVKVVRIDQLPFGESGIAVQLIRIGNPILKGSTIAM